MTAIMKVRCALENRRWNPSGVETLYCSIDPVTAAAEIDNLLAAQPVPIKRLGSRAPRVRAQVSARPSYRRELLAAQTCRKRCFKTVATMPVQRTRSRAEKGAPGVKGRATQRSTAL